MQGGVSESYVFNICIEITFFFFRNYKPGAKFSWTFIASERSEMVMEIFGIFLKNNLKFMPKNYGLYLKMKSTCDWAL